LLLIFENLDRSQRQQQHQLTDAQQQIGNSNISGSTRLAPVQAPETTQPMSHDSLVVVADALTTSADIPMSSSNDEAEQEQQQHHDAHRFGVRNEPLLKVTIRRLVATRHQILVI
jgi:hypothetical protein